MTYKIAVNKCPLCGGWLKVESEVKVEYCFHDGYEALDSTDNEIIEQIYQKTPIKAYCLECGTILDVTYTDAKKHEFTFRAKVGHQALTYSK